MSGIVFAAIAPHGGIVVPELCSQDELGLAEATRGAMEELGRRCADARPEAVVVATPHNVHVDGYLGVVVAGRLEGSVSDDGREIALTCAVDVELALALLLGLVAAEIPAVGLSFGPSDTEQAVMPLDWGALIPLWYLGGRFDPPPPVVLLAPPRDLPRHTLVEAGRVLARVCEASGKRVALVASADHGHAHDPKGPYGYHPAAGDFDQAVVGLVSQNRLAELSALEDLVEDAKADSYWQLLLLQGAIGTSFDVELLSYEAPTYFGMLCAAFRPRVS